MTHIATRTFTIFAATLIATYGSVAVLAQTAQPGPAVIHPRAFDSPDQAVKALLDAASKNDTHELTAIVGSAAQGVLTSGNAAQDQEERREFSRLAAAKSHIEHSSMNSSTVVLLVGDENWPFPIPLVQTGQQWHFDPELGAVEMRARRIGANELDAIEICMGVCGRAGDICGAGIVRQRTPGVRSKNHELARQPRWTLSAWSDSGTRPRRICHGRRQFAGPGSETIPRYYFRVLKEQGPNAPGGTHKYVAGGAMIGGFALIAWPAEYGATGIHTFIVSHDGQVFEKDFGPRTTALTLPIVRYDPDESWIVVD